MKSLAEVVENREASPEILWTFFANEPDEIKKKNDKVLESLRSGVGRGRVLFFGGIDAHKFLPNLHKALKEGQVSILSGQQGNPADFSRCISKKNTGRI